MFVIAIKILTTLLKIILLVIVTGLLFRISNVSIIFEEQELTNATDGSANTSLLHSNSEPAESVADVLFSAFIFLAIIVFGSVAFFGNITTICVALTTKEIRRKRSNYQIMNLAVKDAIMGALFIVMLCTIAPEVNHLSFIAFVLSHSSSITILTVAMERCFAVIAPFQHIRYVTKKALIIVIVIDWCVNISLVITHELVYSYFYRYAFQEVTFIYCLGLLIASVVTFLLHLVMILVVRRHASNINQLTNVSQRRIRQNTNLIVTFALIAGIFLACYLPFAVTILIDLIRGNLNLHKARVILCPFLPFNSAANMFIYWWRIPEFQMAYMRTLCCQRNT
ncbi:lysophosphatidic acid receptor 1-A-like [Anneissia japonica]|uniref:lysophosphatidic acid receptor 1-A-like n=1 Tax=Anneissia japonica TaxID=1529436 RepID=UPI001425A6C0|nr:lysophosphatidic acid receptor 1-A-like [Anneissia japonica]